MNQKGYIHSVESFGTLDGPGIRYVLFMQGCPLRCIYCQNPDTWPTGYGEEVTVEKVVEEVKQYLPYFLHGKGGITISGGEPLLQAEFLTELFKELKKLGIHTAIDTSGYIEIEESIKNLLSFTDLVLLSIKHTDPLKHRLLTEHYNDKVLKFAHYLSKIKKPVWIRYVLIPGLTDHKEDLANLAEFINSISNVLRVEILPYNVMGIEKWKNLGLKYRLEHISPPNDQELEDARNTLKTFINPLIKIC